MNHFGVGNPTKATALIGSCEQGVEARFNVGLTVTKWGWVGLIAVRLDKAILAVLSGLVLLGAFGCQSDGGSVSVSTAAAPSDENPIVEREVDDSEPEAVDVDPSDILRPLDEDDLEAFALPPGHGLSEGQYVVEPGASSGYGNAVLSCPAGGEACVLSVSGDRSATYKVAGGVPVVFTERLPFPISDIVGGELAGGGVDFEGYRDGLDKIVEASGKGGGENPVDVRHGPFGISAREADGGYEEPLIYVGTDQGTNVDWGFIDGVQQSRQGVGLLPVVSRFPALDIRYGRLEDGAGRETLQAFFEAFLSDAASQYLENPGIHHRALRYWATPTVRLIGMPTAGEVKETVMALQVVNSMLPESAQLLMGETAYGLSFPEDDAGRSEWPLENVIAIDFQDAHDAFEEDGSRTEGLTYADNEFREDGSIRWSYVRVARIVAGACEGCDYRLPLVGTLIHELVHALGLYGHVDPFRWRSVVNGFGGGMSALDREALHVLYTRIEPGDRLPLDFGSWDSDSLHIHGNGPFAGFGVVLRNGYGEPWAYGDLPDGDLADSTVLSGWATWTGTLLGLTPDAASVRGDARVGIDLELMSGRVDFTELESWTGAPLAAGTGRPWGDGSLGYAVAVSGNTFRETGGDVGRLSGVFTGIFHEGVAGILERPDLTAAFGGAR